MKEESIYELCFRYLFPNFLSVIIMKMFPGINKKHEKLTSKNKYLLYDDEENTVCSNNGKYFELISITLPNVYISSYMCCLQ